MTPTDSRSRTSSDWSTTRCLLLGDAVFQRSLLNTFLFTAAAVALQTGLGLLLAILLADVPRGKALFTFVFFAPFVLAPVAVGAVWRFLYAPYYGVAASVGSALGFDTLTIAPLAEADTALWAIMAAFLWRFVGFSMVVYLAAIMALPREYGESAALEGAGRFQTFRWITWPLLWPQTFVLVLLTTLGTLRIFDMVWIMTAGGPSHATETVATDIYVTAFRFLQVGYAQAMAMILLVVILLLTIIEYRDPEPPCRSRELVMVLRRIRWSTVTLGVVALIWLYPIAWTLANAVKRSADIYRAPWDLPWPPAVENIGEAWSRGQLGVAMANSAYVTALTVAVVLGLAICGAYALTRLRPPGRGVLFLLVLAPLIIPTEVLIVPMFSIFRALGLINSLPGLALTNVVASISFSTVILAGYFRTIPQDVVDAARVDGAGRVGVLVRIVVPLSRPGILAVAMIVAVFTWNDFGGALVLLQKPEVFTAQLALTRFSTLYATDQGLTFAGMAIVMLPPLLLFLVLQRSFIRGLTAGVVRRGTLASDASSQP